MGLWEIKPQIILLISSFTVGLAAGILFDVYRRMRKLIAPGPFLTALGDLCFWCIITVVTFALLLRISLGQVRGYVFLSIGAGLGVYLHFLSPHVIYLFIILENKVINFFKKVVSLIYEINKLTLVRLVRRIWQDASRILKKIKS